jgi:hypothetical protein
MLSRANFGVRHKLYSMSFISLAKARRKTGRACHRSARARHHSDAGILSLPWRGENLSGSFGGMLDCFLRQINDVASLAYQSY